jgi:hypothetical protein
MAARRHPPRVAARLPADPTALEPPADVFDAVALHL